MPACAAPLPQLTALTLGTEPTVTVSWVLLVCLAASVTETVTFTEPFVAGAVKVAVEVVALWLASTKPPALFEQFEFVVDAGVVVEVEPEGEFDEVVEEGLVPAGGASVPDAAHQE